MADKGGEDQCDPYQYDIKNLKVWIAAYHNAYRKNHGSPGLAIDSGMEADAQRWANVLAQRRRLDHEVSK